MNQVLIVNGRPFAGKRIFAKKIAKADPENYHLVEFVECEGATNRPIVTSYHSEAQGKQVALYQGDLLEVLPTKKKALIYCHTRCTRDIIDFINDLSEITPIEVRSIFVDIDLELTLERYFDTVKNGHVSKEYAETVAQSLMELIHDERFSQHNICYDLIVKTKNIEKAGVKKALKLFDDCKKKHKAEINLKFEAGSSTSHTLGMKTFIYNQLMSYGVINEITIRSLISGVSKMVDLYKGKNEEEI